MHIDIDRKDKRKDMIYPVVGIAKAIYALRLLTTAPIIGGKMVPSEMAARKDPPVLICRPRLRIARIKMVVNQPCDRLWMDLPARM
jgi:hypothetical protein